MTRAEFQTCNNLVRQHNGAYLQIQNYQVYLTVQEHSRKKNQLQADTHPLSQVDDAFFSISEW